MRVYLIFFSIIFLSGCASSRLVAPLSKGEKAVGASFGGPLIGFSSAVIPMPLTSIYGAYGITNRTSAFAGIHTTAATFGVLQLEAGGLFQVLEQKKLKPAISISPCLNMAIDKWKGNFKLWPQLDANAYWRYGNQKKFFYTGVSNWFELASQTRLETDLKHHWVFIPQVGHVWTTTKWLWQVESKWISPNIRSDYTVVDYKTIAHHGSIGIYFTMTRKF